jgi:hypothetical protein
MLTTSEWLENIFLFIFLFGLVFTVVSLVLGFTSAAGLDLGGDAELDFGGDDAGADVDGGDGGDGPGVLNMPTVMAFLTWFGGAGYIFTRTLGFGALLAVPVALLSGFIGGGIMFVLLARLLWPMMSKPLNRADFHLPGTSARVVSSIRAGGVGEIVYSKSGSRFTAGARSADAKAIGKGVEVVILKYERGIAYVQPVAALLDETGGDEKLA